MGGLNGSPFGGAQGATLLPIFAAVAIILIRNARPRSLKIERLWLFPVIYLVLLAAILYGAPPPLTPVSLGLIALGAVLGAAAGWQRGRFTKIEVHPDTHEMTSKASVVGLVFILALMLVRYTLAGWVRSNPALIGVPIVAVTDALFVLAVAMLTVQRIEIWIRASGMLAEAQAKKLDGPGAPPIVQ